MLSFLSFFSPTSRKKFPRKPVSFVAGVLSGSHWSAGNREHKGWRAGFKWGVGGCFGGVVEVGTSSAWESFPVSVLLCRNLKVRTPWLKLMYHWGRSNKGSRVYRKSAEARLGKKKKKDVELWRSPRGGPCGDWYRSCRSEGMLPWSISSRMFPESRYYAGESLWVPQIVGAWAKSFQTGVLWLEMTVYAVCRISVPRWVTETLCLSPGRVSVYCDMCCTVCARRFIGLTFFFFASLDTVRQPLTLLAGIFNRF